MSRIPLLAMLCWLATTTCSAGIAVKVTAADHREGRVALLLPLHHVRIEAMLLPDEPEIRLRVNEFYDAELEQAAVDTVKRNVLKIKIPGQKSVRFRLRKIVFLFQ